MASIEMTDEQIAQHPYKPWYFPFSRTPHFIDQRREIHRHPLFEGQVLAPLLFTLEQSEVRDHCANERTFLSWLRLAVYMALFAVALVIQFHIKSKPSATEKAASLPLGAIFWVLSGGCLINGTALYFRTAEKYGRRRALVQSGWKTQAIVVIVTVAILATCVYFIAINANGK